jgi:hypothetical protein
MVLASALAGETGNGIAIEEHLFTLTTSAVVSGFG